MTPKNTKAGGADAAPSKPPGYEFGGPLGAFAISAGLPALIYVFAFATNDVSGCPPPSLLSPKTLELARLKREVGWPEEGIYGLASWRVTGWVIGYYFLSALLYRILPATETEGGELVSGGRLKYRFNSFASGMFTLAICAAGTFSQGAEFPLWTFISDNYVRIATANILISYFIATFVYVRSFSVKRGNPHRRELARGGCTGNMVYDWFIGRELNPRVKIPVVGEIDIKEWCELRPGLLGWILLNGAWVAKQYRTFGHITDGIVFTAASQAIYVVDSWVNEPAILTTMDITTDGFGFMLAFGDLTWVPFVYSMQARYLAVHPVSLGLPGFAAVFAFLGVGFYLFRASNSQKNAFRSDPADPAVAHLKYIQTKKGTKLLISGWWGVARHINYLGDWLQSWAYSLPTGLAGYTILAADSFAGADEAVFTMADGRQVVAGEARGWAVPITYFYVLYFAVLLIHREARDDEKCRRKYGDDWEKYKRIVRWKIVPGIY